MDKFIQFINFPERWRHAIEHKIARWVLRNEKEKNLPDEIVDWAREWYRRN